MSDVTLSCGFGCSSVDGCQGHCENRSLRKADNAKPTTHLVHMKLTKRGVRTTITEVRNDRD